MNSLYIMFPEKLGKIEPEIYGHFAEHIGGVIYDGIWVGKDSKIENVKGFRKYLIDKLKEINPPVMRWPGGCFAEVYDWRDGIGENRPKRYNWWTPWDNRFESNEVGTHEFMDFCELVGMEPYFAANITSVSPLHMRNWVDYCNTPEGKTTLAEERAENGHKDPFNIKYWGIGNENWGGGGNMTPEQYAMEYRKYSSGVNNIPGEKVLIACGPNADDYAWTKGVMEVMSSSEKHMQGLSLHYYCGFAGDPVNFTKDEWYQQLKQATKMEEILCRHWDIIRAYHMEDHAKLVIDEWGCWHQDGSGPSKGGNLFEQQSSMRDALVTALTLNIFNNHCDKIMMANVAQLVNNLHALFLSCDDQCIVTPTYHVFEMYKDHQGATAIRTAIEKEQLTYNGKDGKEEYLDNLSVSASYVGNTVTITATNLSADEDTTFMLNSVGKELKENAVMKILWNEDYHAHNTFENPNEVIREIKEIKITEPITIPKAGIISIKAEMNS